MALSALAEAFWECPLRILRARFAFEAVWHAGRAVDGRGVRLYKLWARVNLGRENAHRVGRLTGLKGGMVSDGAGNYRKKTLRISLLAEPWRACILWFDMLRSPLGDAYSRCPDGQSPARCPCR